jgi:rod shape-determining protein MreD
VTRRVATIGGLVVAMLVVRNAFFVQFRLFDALPELVLLVVVGVALTDGPESAAIVGFCAGMLQDLSLTSTPVGLYALAFVLVGFSVGRAQGYVIRPGRLLPLGLAAAAAFGAHVLVVLAAALVGGEFLVSAYQLRVGLWTAVYSTALFPPVLALTRRVLAASRLGRAPA